MEQARPDLRRRYPSLTQASGFKGLLGCVEPAEANALSTPDGPDVALARVDVHAACSTPARDPGDDNHVVSRVDELLWLHPHVVVCALDAGESLAPAASPGLDALSLASDSPTASRASSSVR